MEEVQIVQVRPWYHKPAPYIAAGVFICLCVLALPHAQRVYHRWSEVRKVKRASEALARGDYKEATLQARGALATDAKHVEALRLLARTAEAVNSPADALKFRRQIDAIKPGDPENVLGIADNCLKTAVFTAAQEALRSLPPEAQTSAKYYDVAAGIALGQKDLPGAEIYATKAAQAEPANANYQLRLAGLRLSSKDPERQTEAVKVLQQLSTKPTSRSRALRLLLQNALERGDSSGAIELGSALTASTDATFADKLTELTALYALREKSSGATNSGRPVTQTAFLAKLEELQRTASGQPETIYQMIMWMNEHNMALLVPDFAASLPAEQVAKPPVAVAVADSYTRASQWDRLRQLVEPASWDRTEFLRFAYLSRALEGLEDRAGSSAAWTRAVETAQAQVPTMEALARETAKWRWKQQNDEVMWKLADKPSCPRWVVDALWTSALQRQDATQLFKLSKLILQAEPKSLIARNHFISLALMTGQDTESPHELADAHYRKYPENQGVASTYAFSLFLQGRAEEAVSVMAKFPKEQMRQPALAFYQGIFLAAAGRPEEGEEYFRIGEQSPQFEQMIAIRNFLRTVFEADAAARGGDAAKAAQAWQTALQAARARPQWLDIFGRVALKRGEMERAGEAALKLADAGQCPAWAAEPLWVASVRGGNPAQIQKASKLILDANPKSLTARSNFIVVALLGGKEGEAAYQQAETFSRENPSQSEAAAAYAYALYRQGQNEKALALLKTLDPQQLQQPRLALYYSLVLAAAGNPDEAMKVFPQNLEAGLLPEEKLMGGVLRGAFDCRTADQRGDTTAANEAWTKALVETRNRPEMLELLGQMAQKWQAPGRAEEALWKLADAPSTPRWAIDVLLAAAEKSRDSGQLFPAARLLRRAEPQNTSARVNYVRLALLTRQTAEMPDRQARELYESDPRNPEAAATYALALHQQDRTDRALEVLAALTPEQLHVPRVAFYYGAFLTAAGQEAKAREYLQAGAQLVALPEEQTLLTKSEKRRASREP